MSAAQSYQDAQARLARNLVTPGVASPPPVSLADAYSSRLQRRGGGQSASLQSRVRRAGSQVGRHVSDQLQSAQSGSSPNQNGGYGTGTYDEGDPSVQEGPQLGELGSADLNKSGQRFTYDPAAQNWMPAQQQQQPAIPQPQTLGPKVLPQTASVGPKGPELSPLQLAPGQTVPPHPAVQTPQMPAAPTIAAGGPGSGVAQPWQMEIVRGTGPNAQVSNFDTGTDVETPVSGGNAFLAPLKGRISDEDFNLLNQYSQQPGVTPQHLMSAADAALQRNTAAQHYKDSQGRVATQAEMAASRERIANLRTKRRDAESAYHTAATSFAKNFPGAGQPNANGQILNADGSVDADATAGWKSVMDAQAGLAPIDSSLDSELKSFGQPPATPAAASTATSAGLGAPIPYQPGMKFQPGMQIKTSKGVFTVAGIDAQGNPNFQAAQ